MEKYIFNKEKHLHQLLVDGEYKNLTGCTTVLGVLAKPALIQWAADMTAIALGWTKATEWQEVNGKLKKIEIPLEKRLEALKPVFSQLMQDSEELFLKRLDDARVAHAKRKEKAGDYGTKTHALVEELIKNAIEKDGGYIMGRTTSPDKSIQNFIDWAVNNEVKFLESEKNVYSEKMFTGGIVDIVCEIGGEVWIGDIKTAKSGLYAENFWQMGGYQLMLNEMGLYENVKGYVLLNLKEDGTFEEKRSVSTKEHERGFLACLEIYRLQEQTKKTAL